jgi:2-polyprenyl-3-methyl-5-hydroxy-6-metoxy-1,4-benzoquinol methylase
MFRSRELLDESDKFTENAWDNVERRGVDLSKALAKLEADESAAKAELCDYSSGSWNTFYLSHGLSFFKDRKWIKDEFGEAFTTKGSRILEIGCGVGNSLSSEEFSHLTKYMGVIFPK